MDILHTVFNWKSKISMRCATKYIVLHHAAMTGSVKDIHRVHINKGWAGIGYHFYIRKDGKIYSGRPLDYIGAHCVGYNATSVGVCFEGNYETTAEMPAAQIKAGQELVEYLKKAYPKAAVVRHKDLTATACPGKYFPFDRIAKGVIDMKKELTSANDITWELSQRININDIDGFVAALEKAKQEDSPLYWGFRKIVNK